MGFHIITNHFWIAPWLCKPPNIDLHSDGLRKPMLRSRKPCSCRSERCSWISWIVMILCAWPQGLISLGDLQDPNRWRYVSTIFLAIFCGDIGLIHDRYLLIWPDEELQKPRRSCWKSMKIWDKLGKTWENARSYQNQSSFPRFQS